MSIAWTQEKKIWFTCSVNSKKVVGFHMNVLKPDKHFKKVENIPFELLREWGIKGILLDIDNTVTPHGKSIFSSEILDWIEEADKRDYKLLLLSNNLFWRIKKVSNILKIPYVIPIFFWKPSSRFFLKGAKKINLEAAECVMIGDKPHRDIKGGNNVGMKTILVDPVDPKSDRLWTKVRRRIAERK